MKILKPGDGRKAWAREFTCTGKGNGNGGCGALLLVEEGDLFHTSNSCLGETETYTTFRCPQCRVLTDVSVPGGVKVRNKE